MAKIVSANRLTDGAVVYLGPTDAWVERIEEAATYSDAVDVASGLDSARASERRNWIVDPIVVEVTADAGGVRPATLRDRIRAQGPTIAYLPVEPTPARAEAA